MEGLIKKWRKGFRVYYQVLYQPPQWITDRGISWLEKSDKRPKTSDTYTRDPGNGRFGPKKTDSEAPENSECLNPNFSEPAKSLSLKSDERVSSFADYPCVDYWNDPIKDLHEPQEA